MLPVIGLLSPQLGDAGNPIEQQFNYCDQFILPERLLD